MVIGDLYAIRFRHTLTGTNLDNNCNYIVRAVGTDADPAAAVCGAWYAAFSVAMTALQGIAVDYQYVDATNLNDAEEYYRMDVTGETLNGGGVGTEQMAFWNAIAYSKRPRNRLFGTGKFRVRGLTEQMLTNRSISQDFTQQVEDMRDTIGMSITTLGGAELEPIVLSQARVPADPNLPFEEWVYTYTTIAGITLVGVSHKVQN